MQVLITVLRQDPLLVYSVAAALVLLAAALIAGFNRLDFVAVFHPHGLLAVVSAVLTSLVLMVCIAWLERNLLRVPWLWLDTLPESAFPLVGAWRLPLYVVALAYGPSAGLTAAALITAFSARTGLPGWQEGLLAFELVTVGWLAIAPNPRAHSWAGTFNILLAHLLTLITMGLALLRWQQRPLTLTELWQLSGNVSGGVLLSALVVAYVTPAVYARVFTTSRIVPPTERTPHMPLPPLTALAHAGSLPTVSLNTPSPHTLPQTSTSTATTPTLATSDSRGDNQRHLSEHHPRTSSRNNRVNNTSNHANSISHKATLTTLPTLHPASKRPSERHLSVPAFFEVDNSAAFENGSFEPYDPEHNDPEHNDPETSHLESAREADNLKANEK